MAVLGIITMIATTTGPIVHQFTMVIATAAPTIIEGTLASEITIGIIEMTIETIQIGIIIEIETETGAMATTEVIGSVFL
jgi:hypothetical protein